MGDQQEDKENPLKELKTKKKRRVIVESDSDEDLQPATKRQSLAPEASSGSENDSDVKSEGDESSAGSDNEEADQSDDQSGISESELDFLRKDAEEMNIRVSPTKKRRRRVKMMSDDDDDENDEEEKKPSKSKKPV